MRRRTGVTIEQCERRIQFAALSALPILHSNPFAQAKLFIDFNGDPGLSDWLGFTVTPTGAYDTDGNKNDFSTSELADIQQLWANVAELYSPFNIDVTTQDPGNRANRRTSQIVVGGSVDDWFKQDAGGVAPLGAFFNSAPNTGFVFSDDAFGDISYLTQAIAHEAGHTFGLRHQSTFTPEGSLDQEYNPGTPDLGQIMGFPLFNPPRVVWFNEFAHLDDDDNAAIIQDDLALLSGSANGFGYRFDDYGDTRFAGLEVSPDANGEFTFSGVIEQNTDIDAFNFTAGAGTLTINLSNSDNFGMLDTSVSVVDPFGTVIATVATASFDESLSVSVQAGSYTILVSGAGEYWDVGQFTLEADVPAGAANSDHLLVEGQDFDDVITVNLDAEGNYELNVNGDIQTIDPNTIKQFDILAGGGNDTVRIGHGVAKVYVLGGDGDDSITGGDFDDTLTGSAGNDLIDGGSGNDRVEGGNGHDNLVGGAGDDRMFGEVGNDVIVGGTGTDRMFGGDGNDVLNGNADPDKILGEAGHDTLYGQQGNDTIDVGDGIDQFYGGDGDDIFASRDLLVDMVNGGAGFDSAEADDDDDTLISLEELLA